jgi:alcohol dehydrogenase class IV
MFHPELGPIARLFIAVAVFAPSLSAGYAVTVALMAVGVPEIVAAVPAALTALAGILALTYGAESLANWRADAVAAKGAAGA